MDRIALTALAALSFGGGYAAIVHAVYRRHPHNPYTWAFVAGGVFGTLAIAALLVPPAQVAIVGGLFVLTGLPQIAAAMLRNLHREAEAGRIIAEAIRRGTDGDAA